MGLNKEGIALLKEDLIANATHYNQRKFGVITPDCGTEACMAGLCLMRKIGLQAFTTRVKESQHEALMEDCLSAAVEQLGLELLTTDQYDDIAVEMNGEEGDGLPPIFSAAGYWPENLRNQYQDAEMVHDHLGMAKVACAALDRIDEQGFIG